MPLQYRAFTAMRPFGVRALSEGGGEGVEPGVEGVAEERVAGGECPPLELVEGDSYRGVEVGIFLEKLTGGALVDNHIVELSERHEHDHLLRGVVGVFRYNYGISDFTREVVEA